MTTQRTYKKAICAFLACAILFGCVKQDKIFLGNVIPHTTTSAPPSILPVVATTEPSNDTTASQTDYDGDEKPKTEASFPPTLPQQSPPKNEESPAPTNEQKTKRTKRYHSMLISHEVRHSNIDMFPRWTGMLERYETEANKLNTICGDEQHNPCKLKEWKSFLEGIKNEPLYKQLEEINRFVNKYPYVDDIVNWGFNNYWETPYEFQRKSGNCKDYAIAKFMSLRALGVPNELMRILVVKDLNLRGTIHAVLIVYSDEKSYILDNQIKQVMPAEKIYHYMPIYSINESNWWRHTVLQ